MEQEEKCSLSRRWRPASNILLLKGVETPDLWPLHLKPHSTETVGQLLVNKYLFVANNWNWTTNKVGRVWKVSECWLKADWLRTTVWYYRRWHAYSDLLLLNKQTNDIIICLSLQKHLTSTDRCRENKKRWLAYYWKNNWQHKRTVCFHCCIKSKPIICFDYPVKTPLRWSIKR